MIKRLARGFIWTLCALLFMFALAGCLADQTASEESEIGKDTEEEQEPDGGGTVGTDDPGAADGNGSADGKASQDTDEGGNPDESETAEILTFVDVLGNAHQVEIQNDWPMHSYDPDGFVHDGDALSYASDDDTVTFRLGVDVSHYQGSIDWEKVKAAGYDFAFVRIGFRGYGSAGTLNADKRYKENLIGALEAGLDVGVYFFSQAISEEEAVEEAEYVLSLLDEADIALERLTLPVVFDPETIGGDTARTDDVTGEQFTKNAVAFCDRIIEAGAAPMIYANMLWEAYKLDLGELSDYPVWYADYEMVPQTPYDFSVWQYSESAHVDGISGLVDVDIWMIP